jgi:hypothetical protein
MESDLIVRQVTNADAAFYPLIGPFLARREIERETGARIWDDDGKTWFAAERDGAAAGFCAATAGAVRVTFCSDYMLPAWRGTGAYGLLFAARMAWLGARPARASCTAASLPAYLAAGFTVAGERGRYTEVRHGD